MGDTVKVAVISGVVAISSLIIKEIVAPSLSEQEVQQQINDARPTWEIFETIYTDKSTTQSLGAFDMCALMTVGSVHENQACTCQLGQTSPGQPSNAWTLHVELNEDLEGSFCRCQAACLNFN